MCPLLLPQTNKHRGMHGGGRPPRGPPHVRDKTHFFPASLPKSIHPKAGGHHRGCVTWPRPESMG
jgi:hypothetical protein